MQNIVSSLIETLETRRFLSGSAPAAPSALIETTSSDSTISLTWTDNSSNETGFRIDRWNGHGWNKVAKVAANVTTFTDTHLKASKFYAYRVFAYNKAGNSSTFAFVGDASTLAKGAVIAPAAFAATKVSASDIVLQFSDNSKSEAGYNIQASANGGAWTTVGGIKGTDTTGTRAFDFAGAQSGQTYSFRIAAYTATRFGDYSSPVVATDPVADTVSPVLAGGQHFTSDVQVFPGVNSPEPIHVVNIHLINSDGTPDTNFSGDGSDVISQTVSSDQQPAQFLVGLPDGRILESLTGEVHSFPPGPEYYYWFKEFRILGEQGGDLNYSFGTPTTSGPQSAPPPVHLFVQPDGQIIFATDGVTHAPPLSSNAATPTVTVVDDLGHLVWMQPLPSVADSVVGLPNDLVAITSGGHVTVFNSSGQKIAGP